MILKSKQTAATIKHEQASQQRYTMDTTWQGFGVGSGWMYGTMRSRGIMGWGAIGKVLTNLHIRKSTMGKGNHVVTNSLIAALLHVLVTLEACAVLHIVCIQSIQNTDTTPPFLSP